MKVDHLLGLIRHLEGNTAIAMSVMSLYGLLATFTPNPAYGYQEFSNCRVIQDDQGKKLRCDTYQVSYQNRRVCKQYIHYDEERDRRFKREQCFNQAIPIRQYRGYEDRQYQRRTQQP